MSDIRKWKSEIESANIPVSFCLNPAYDNQKNPVFWLKINGGEIWELNIQISTQEFELFSKVKAACWDERPSVKIGKCLGFPTFWSCNEGILNILVGEDDETWEVAVALHENDLDNLFEKIEAAKSKYKLKDNKWLK